MALSDNPFIGLSLTTLQGLQTNWLQALSDIQQAGQSYSIAGRSFTRGQLAEVRETLRLLKIAIDYTTGRLKQYAQITIDTQSQYDGTVP